MASWETHHGGYLNLGDYRANYPFLWKILIFVSPQALMEMLNPMLGVQSWENPSPSSLSLLGLRGDVALGFIWIVLLISTSYILFAHRHRNVLEVKR